MNVPSYMPKCARYEHSKIVILDKLTMNTAVPIIYMSKMNMEWNRGKYFTSNKNAPLPFSV